MIAKGISVPLPARSIACWIHSLVASKVKVSPLTDPFDEPIRPPFLLDEIKRVVELPDRGEGLIAHCASIGADHLEELRIFRPPVERSWVVIPPGTDSLEFVLDRPTLLLEQLHESLDVRIRGAEVHGTGPEPAPALQPRRTDPKLTTSLDSLDDRVMNHVDLVLIQFPLRYVPHASRAHRRRYG